MLNNIFKRYASSFIKDTSDRLKEKKVKQFKESFVKINSKAMRAHFNDNERFDNVQSQIPVKYLTIKKSTIDNLYLIDGNVAKKTVDIIMPYLNNIKPTHKICESNVGMGFISKELLKRGVKNIRLYESCFEFREKLKNLLRVYPQRVELFTKDIFLLSRYDYMDKQDHGNRVQQIFKGIQKNHWEEDPVMTIIGPISNTKILSHLFKSLTLHGIETSFGRLQLFVFMKQSDYELFTASPSDNNRRYQRRSILSKLLLDFDILDEFSNKCFIPWEAPRKGKINNSKNLYFVRINFKKKFPLPREDLLSFSYFIRTFFGLGTSKIIPIAEKWVPGSGLNIITPRLKHNDYFENINIFTKFRELNPEQILAVYKEVKNHLEFDKSPFTSMIESHLIKNETIETALSDTPEIKIDDIEICFEKLKT